MTEGRRMLRSAAAVFVGGLVGTSLRIGIDTAIPHPDDAFPVSTLVINVVGSFALAVLIARVWPRASEWVRAGLGPGLLGSFTTFSAVAVSLVSLVEADSLPVAVLYLGLTLLLGFGAAALGLSLGGPVSKRPTTGGPASSGPDRIGPDRIGPESVGPRE